MPAPQTTYGIPKYTALLLVYLTLSAWPFMAVIVLKVSGTFPLTTRNDTSLNNT